MKDVPAELLYVLMFLAIALLQYLMKRFAPQEPQDSAQDGRHAQTFGEPEQTPVAKASDAVIGNIDRIDASGTALPRRRFSRSSLMGTRRGVQNAVVLATILGPCRAFEPHDVRQ